MDARHSTNGTEKDAYDLVARGASQGEGTDISTNRQT